jgi:phosphomannomutase
MLVSEKILKKLANGSDVRGVAVEGVPDEPVTLSVEAANVIAGGFLEFLAEKTGKEKKKLRVAVGHDSRISAASLKKAVLEALTAAGCVTVDCGMASTPSMFMSTVFPETSMDGSIMITASHHPWYRNGFKLITRIQDEAHRFAIEYHRSLRSRNQVHSVLDEIPGIGEKRRRALMQHFESIEQIRNADKETLLKVPEIWEREAEAILAFFRSQETKRSNIADT